MTDQKPNRAELLRLANMFRHFAGETGDPQFQKTFLRAARDLERMAGAARESGET